MDEMTAYSGYGELVESIGSLLSEARVRIASSVNTEKDRLTVQYALEGINNQLFVSRYQLYLPDREALSREVYRIIEAHTETGDPEDKQ